MKTSNLKSIFALLLLAAVSFTSCKKDDPAPQDPIAGSWVGKFGVDNTAPNTFFSFNILPNGILQVRDEQKKILGTGTWKIDGGTFTGIYTYNPGNETYNLAAKYDEAAGELTGSWGYGETDASAGEFYLDKQ